MCLQYLDQFVITPGTAANGAASMRSWRWMVGLAMVLAPNVAAGQIGVSPIVLEQTPGLITLSNSGAQPVRLTVDLHDELAVLGRCALGAFGSQQWWSAIARELGTTRGAARRRFHRLRDRLRRSMVEMMSDLEGADRAAVRQWVGDRST